MPAPADPLTGRSLMAIFAHPDDESIACGGLLARCAAGGARVSLVCATRGGAGEIGKRRALELDAAAQILGISDLVVLDHEDGMLPWIEASTLEADIHDAIRQHHPDVVITFGEDGLYWHLDHIAIHERTTAAVARFGNEGPALYYVSMPPGAMRAVMNTIAERSQTPTRAGILGIIEVDAYGSFAAAPTLVIEAGEFAVRKLAAIKCHRSQVEGEALDLLSGGDAAPLLGTEHFRRAIVGAQGDTFIEGWGHARRPA